MASPSTIMAMALMTEPWASTTAAIKPHNRREKYSGAPNLSAIPDDILVEESGTHRALQETQDIPLAPTVDWVRRVSDDVAPHATGGTYVNALDPERPIGDAYTDYVLARLVAVKRCYDPDGVLSGNGI